MKKMKGFLIAASIGVALVWGGKSLDLQHHLTEVLGEIQDLGASGMGLYIGLYIIAAVFLIPGSLLTLGAGAIYGVGTGALIASISSTLGATAAFLVGRYLVRNWMVKKFKGHSRFEAIDNAVADEGWKIVGLTRLSPLSPYNILNYAYGLTRVSLREYVLASWIGMMPCTVMYVYLGSLAGDLARLGSPTDRATTPVEWALYGLGLITTIGVTIYLTQIAKKALATRIAPKE